MKRAWRTAPNTGDVVREVGGRVRALKGEKAVYMVAGDHLWTTVETV